MLFNRKLPAQAFIVILSFAAGSQASTVHCGFANDNWRGTDMLYTCTGAFSFSGNENLTAITGDHLTGQLNADVTGVSFFNQFTTFNGIPPNIGTFFANIEAFEWKFGNVTTLSSADVAQFPNLRMLSLYGNHITSLLASLFQGAAGVRHIDFGANALNFVEVGFLNGLDIETALFERNPCVSFSAATPSSMQELGWYLEECMGPEIDATLICAFSRQSWLGGSSNLHTCSATIMGQGLNGTIGNLVGEPGDGPVTAFSAYNQRGLQGLPRNLHEFLPELTAFEWVFGHLSYISEADLFNFSELTIFIAYGNRLITLEPSLFRGNPSLIHLDVGANWISYAAGVIDHLYNLEVALFERNTCISYSAATPNEIENLRSFLEYDCRHPVIEECLGPCAERIMILEERVDYLETQINSLMKLLKTQEKN